MNDAVDAVLQTDEMGRIKTPRPLLVAAPAPEPASWFQCVSPPDSPSMMLDQDLVDLRT
jgi:hypothetical protein